MSNVLKLSLQEAIRSLHEKGWGQRRIARELGIHRNTVKGYSEGGSKCTTQSTAGSVPVTDSKGTGVSTAGSEGSVGPLREAHVAGFTSQIGALVRAGQLASVTDRAGVEEDGGVLSAETWADFIADVGLTVITIDTVLADRLLLKVGTK